MKIAPFNMLLQTASKNNILILTTKCGTSCIFCSHGQNPDNIEVYCVKDVTMDEFKSLLEFIDKNKKITIGESATRICEGEPFAHKHIMEMLELLRLRFPNTIIQITTSAVYLTHEVLQRLSDLKNIELNISLNSSSEEGRKILYKGNGHIMALEAVKAISQYNIIYSGSIVAMPHLVGYEDIVNTIKFLSQYNAQTIRIFKPGITKHCKLPELPENIDESLTSLVKDLRKEITTPIILEPPRISSLNAIVVGVVKGSKAYEAGILIDDIILKVNNKKVMSRVDAYNRIYQSDNIILQIQRNNKTHKIVIDKSKNTTAGLVFEYDIHPYTIRDIKKVLKKYNNKKCLIITSELGYNVISQCDFEADNYLIAKIKNSFFGGNIKNAGLLVISDIDQYIQSLDKTYDVLLLPSIMLDDYGKDLTGVHYMELNNRYEMKIELI